VYEKPSWKEEGKGPKLVKLNARGKGCKGLIKKGCSGPILLRIRKRGKADTVEEREAKEERLRKQLKIELENG